MRAAFLRFGRYLWRNLRARPMTKLLPLTAILALLLTAGCNQPKPADSEPAATASPAATPVPADSLAALRAQVAEPQAGDVYVVQFQKPGAARRYFFYHVFRATADSAYLHPARKDAPSAEADLTQPDFRASDNTMVYTRAELAELLREQPGDVNHARLVRVRRAD